MLRRVIVTTVFHRHFPAPRRFPAGISSTKSFGIQIRLTPPSLTLIRDGRLIERNLRKEMITEEELKSQLREQNVEDLAEIKIGHA